LEEKNKLLLQNIIMDSDYQAFLLHTSRSVFMLILA